MRFRRPFLLLDKSMACSPVSADNALFTKTKSPSCSNIAIGYGKSLIAEEEKSLYTGKFLKLPHPAVLCFFFSQLSISCFPVLLPLTQNISTLLFGINYYAIMTSEIVIQCSIFGVFCCISTKKPPKPLRSEALWVLLLTFESSSLDIGKESFLISA